MSYRQLEEPMFVCPKCHKSLSLNDDKLKYGLFADGKLIRCSSCFEEIKHEFWLRIVAEEE